MVASADENARQHLKVSHTMWDIVEKVFDPVKVLTREGYDLIQTYSIKAVHPVLPYVLHFLAMMCAMANGARTRWFPNYSNPLFIMALNVNYTQTRKSSLTGNGDECGDKLVASVRAVVQKKYAIAMGPGGVGNCGKRPVVVSSVLHSATMTELFHRVSGDFPQVSNVDNLGVDGLEGRHGFGFLGNWDEYYDLLNGLNLTGADDGKNQKAKSVVNAYQSAFNKLAQYGQASRATKTAGSYGEAATPTISAGMSGNMHFST